MSVKSQFGQSVSRFPVPRTLSMPRRARKGLGGFCSVLCEEFGDNCSEFLVLGYFSFLSFSIFVFRSSFVFPFSFGLDSLIWKRGLNFAHRIGADLL